MICYCMLIIASCVYLFFPMFLLSIFFIMRKISYLTKTCLIGEVFEGENVLWEKCMKAKVNHEKVKYHHKTGTRLYIAQTSAQTSKVS